MTKAQPTQPIPLVPQKPTGFSVIPPLTPPVTGIGTGYPILRPKPLDGKGGKK